jgi:MFS family permease
MPARRVAPISLLALDRSLLMPPVQHLVRRLLDLDRPYPTFEGEALEHEVRRNYRWNLTVSVGEVGLFFFGMSFIAASTILPLFISKLTSSTFAVGLVALLAQGGWSLPQLLTAHATERVPRMLPIMVRIGFFAERLPLWALVVAASLAVRAPTAALILAVIGYAWFTLGGGAIAPAWQELVGRCFPVDRRGFYMGFGSFVGTGFGALGAAASVALLAALPYPKSFVAVFGIGALSVLVSLFFMMKVREPVPAHLPPHQSTREFWSGIRDILRAPGNFRWYLGSRVVMALTGLATGFVTLSAIRIWRVSDATVGAYTGVSLVGEAIGLLAAGVLADRRGHKLPLELAALSYAAAFGLAAWSPDPGVYFPVFVLIGLGLGGQITSGVMLTLEFAPPGRQPTYAGLVNTVLGIVGVAAPLVGAWLAERDFTLLFLVGACLSALSFLLFFLRVRDPRHITTAAPGWPPL